MRERAAMPLLSPTCTFPPEKILLGDRDVGDGSRSAALPKSMSLSLWFWESHKRLPGFTLESFHALETCGYRRSDG